MSDRQTGQDLDLDFGPSESLDTSFCVLSNVRLFFTPFDFFYAMETTSLSRLARLLHKTVKAYLFASDKGRIIMH